MLETVKSFYKSHPGTVQLPIRSVNTVERKMIILNRKRKKKRIRHHLQPLDIQGVLIISRFIS